MSDDCKLVVTETSLYYIDGECSRVFRMPGSGLGKHPSALDVPPVNELRRDNDFIDLVELVRCEKNETMLMVLDIAGNGIVTVRETTLVHNIVSVDHIDHDAIGQ